MVKIRFALSIFFAFLLTFSIISCEKALETKEEVQKYLADQGNGLQRTETIEDVQVKLTYQPWQLIAARSPKRKNASKEIKGYAGKYFFLLSFSKKGKELLRQLDYNTYSEMVQVFAFRMPAYISLIPDGKDAIEPVDCLFHQTYGMSDASSLLLIFDSKKLKGAKQLTLRVEEFGLGLGTLSLSLDTKRITQIPDIIIK